MMTSMLWCGDGGDDEGYEDYMMMVVMSMMMIATHSPFSHSLSLSHPITIHVACDVQKVNTLNNVD